MLEEKDSRSDWPSVGDRSSCGNNAMLHPLLDALSVVQRPRYAKHELSTYIPPFQLKGGGDSRHGGEPAISFGKRKCFFLMIGLSGPVRVNIESTRIACILLRT